MTILFYSLIISCSFLASLTSTKKEDRIIFPRLTLITAVILTLLYLSQFIYPHLLLLFQRDASAIFSGEIWRVLTALFFQDGGPIGAAFNIISVLLIGSVAEQYFSARQWFALFFLGGLLTEAIALFWQPTGAGNSVANFSLSGALLVSSLRQNKTIVRALSATGIISGLILLSAKDIHGAAVLIGICLWLILNKLSKTLL